MAVYKIGGKWRAEPYVRGHRVGSRMFDRRDEAKEWHDEQRRLHKGEKSKKAATMEEAIKRFETYHLPTCRPRTKLRYELELRRMQPDFRFMKLDRITVEQLEAYKLKLQASLAPRTVNNALDVVRLVLARAQKYGLIEKSPYNLDHLPVPKESYNWWDDKRDIQAFLDAARPSRYYPAYLLALETGMRLGEIQGLGKSDIDFERGRIHVHRQWNEELHDYGPLKDTDPRWIDFAPEGYLAQVLRATTESSPTEVAIPSRTGKNLSKSKLSGKIFHQLQEKAGVPRITFHELRDTCASWYMLEHDNMWALTAILGHSHERVTKRYAHLSKRHRQKPLDMAKLLTQESRRNQELRDVSMGK